MWLETRRRGRVILPEIGGIPDLAVYLRDLGAVRLLQDERGAQLLKHRFGLRNAACLEEVHGAPIRNLEVVRLERLEFSQRLIGPAGLAGLREERRVEAQGLAVPGIAGKHFLEALAGLYETAPAQEEPAVLCLEPEVARLLLQEALENGSRLVELATAVVDAEKTEQRRAVLWIELQEAFVNLFGLRKLVAALEGLAIEEQDGGSVRAVEDAFEHRGGLLRLLEAEEDLRIRNGSLRIGGRQLVRRLQLGGGFFEASLVLRGREEHLSKKAVRSRAARGKLDGLAGLLLGLGVHREVAQELAVFPAQAPIGRIQLDGLLEFPDGRLELAFLGVELRPEVVLHGLAAAAFLLAERVLDGDLPGLRTPGLGDERHGGEGQRGAKSHGEGEKTASIRHRHAVYLARNGPQETGRGMGARRPRVPRTSRTPRA